MAAIDAKSVHFHYPVFRKPVMRANGWTVFFDRQEVSTL
ncbi:hypothetical protein KIS4809_2848 [Bacillus sp. ZZV12-4809]|nr:hypothetical protein KIS4809_2848 [Bacillus sp. ZZV12-4809]